jgi:hypothetical protein
MDVNKLSVKGPEDLANMSESEYKALMSLIGKLQWELKGLKNLSSLKEARKMAADEVASKLVPQVTGQELENALGVARQRLYKDARIEGIRRSAARRALEKELEETQKERDIRAMQRPTYYPSQPVIINEAPGIAEVVRATAPRAFDRRPAEKRVVVVDAYRSWCFENDEVPLDGVLAHFTGKTPEAFAFARSVLTKEGFVFEKKNRVWHVMARPSNKRTYSEADVKKAVEAALRAVGAKGK